VKLVEKMIDGLGGRSALLTVDVTRSVATINVTNRAPEDPVQIEMLSSFPDRHLARVQTAQGVMTIAVDGSDAYVRPVKSTIRGAAIRLTADERNDLLHYFSTDPFFVARNARSSEYRFLAAERESIAGTECQALRVSQLGTESKWWIDLTSGRVVRSEFRGRQNEFSEWRTVGRLSVPYVVTTSSEGKVISQARFIVVEVNPAIDVAESFRKPDLWLARWSLPARDARASSYSSYQAYSSYSGYSGSSQAYSGYTYRPPVVYSPAASSIVIWDTRAGSH
jgi:hypothetical protein